MQYQERFYRNKIINHKLHAFHVTVRETDLFILSDSNHSDLAYSSVYKYRGYIESYIKYHSDFLSSLTPLGNDDLAPEIVRAMIMSAKIANVGPMAAVAGAMAEYVGRDILNISNNVIVENGGDIFLKTNDDITVAIFAGNSKLSNKISIRIRKDQMPMGLCTSSGTVGHSLSYGRADAVCVLANSATTADAVATAIGNVVQKKSDFKLALKKGMAMEGVYGILIVLDDQMAVQGKVELV